VSAELPTHSVPTTHYHPSKRSHTNPNPMANPNRQSLEPTRRTHLWVYSTPL